MSPESSRVRQSKRVQRRKDGATALTQSVNRSLMGLTQWYLEAGGGWPEVGPGGEVLYLGRASLCFLITT